MMQIGKADKNIFIFHFQRCNEMKTNSPNESVQPDY